MLRSAACYFLVMFVIFCGVWIEDKQHEWHQVVESILPLYVANTGLANVELFDVDATAENRVGLLRPGSWLEYEYSGASGRWIYLSHLSDVAVVRDGNLDMGIVIFDHFVSLKQLVAFLVLIIIGCILFTLRYLNKNQALAKANKDTERVEMDRKLINALRNANASLQARLNTAEQVARANNVAIALQKEQLDQVGQARHDAIKRYQEEISTNRDMLDEFQQRTNVQISDLERSFERVQQKFESLIADVRYYDVDYHDVKFESLLKGRQFEIAVAKLLQGQFGCKILEWTPDKGTVFAIKVEQNGNPDLLLESQNGDRFAVECKFRSGYARDEVGQQYSPRLINWAYASQAQRYAEYGNRMSVNGYVAIGLFGDAQSPAVQLIVPLPTLLSKSTERTAFFSGGASAEQLCTPHVDIRKLTIEKQDIKYLIPEVDMREPSYAD